MLIDINVRFNGDEKEEAAGLLNYICGNKKISDAKVNVQPDPRPKKEAQPEAKVEPQGKRELEKTVTVTPAIVEAKPAPTLTEAPTTEPAKAYTFQEVRAASKKLIEDKGSEVFAAILKQIGAARLPDVKPEQYAKLMEAINAR